LKYEELLFPNVFSREPLNNDDIAIVQVVFGDFCRRILIFEDRIIRDREFQDKTR